MDPLFGTVYEESIDYHICWNIKRMNHLSGIVYEESIDYHICWNIKPIDQLSKNKMDFDIGLNMDKLWHQFHSMFCFALAKSALQNVFIDTLKILLIYLHLVLKMLYFFPYLLSKINSVITWSGNLVFSWVITHSKSMLKC